MLTFPMLSLASGIKAFMTEMNGTQSLKLAHMSTVMHEHRLTAFLGYVLNDLNLPYSLTVQERYYLLIQYLSGQGDTDLETKTDYSRYICMPRERWLASYEIEGITVHQLKGFQVELLQECSEDISDWVFGAMMLQIESPELGQLPSGDDKTVWARLLHERLPKFLDLPQSDIDRHHQLFSIANAEMCFYVNYSFDGSGVVCLGGADDAPMRFCPTTALRGIFDALARALDVGRTAASSGHEHESGGSPE